VDLRRRPLPEEVVRQGACLIPSYLARQLVRKKGTIERAKCKAKVLLADFARTVKSEHTVELANRYLKTMPSYTGFSSKPISDEKPTSHQ